MKPTKEQIEAAIKRVENGLETAFGLQSVLFALTYLKLSMGEPSDGVRICINETVGEYFCLDDDFAYGEAMEASLYETMRDQQLKETEEALNE